MLAQLLVIASPLAAVYLLVTVWYRRLKQFAHFPQLKPSLIWGHLQTLHEFSQRSPPGLHIDAILTEIARQLGNPPIMMLDLRPVVGPLAVVNSYEVAEQITRSTKAFPWSVPKSPTMSGLVRVIGQHSILRREGEDWKQVRKRFNPGFAPGHLMSLLPCILDKTAIFLEQLDRHASTGDEFPLLKHTINLTFDIIGAISMNVDFDAQKPEPSRQGEFISLYEQLLSLYGQQDGRYPRFMYPRREWRRFRLSEKIDRHLEAMIREKHAEQQQQQQQQAQAGQGRAGSTRSILSLSLQDSRELSKAVLHETRDQIKTFLFAGHDTTGILLAWVFYELSRTPHVLEAVRAELDDIFGPDADPAAVREKLLAPGGEDLIHRMTYTSAVIKEVLRLYPPAGTARMVPPGSGFVLRMPDGGRELCVDGVVLYNCATIIQRDRSVFGDSADDFVPERWLGDKSGIMSAGAQDDKAEEQQAVDGGTGRKYPAGAWRPFERGPRNCIGQDLATIEARVIVAAVARRYDFVKVGLGELDLDEKGRPVLDEKRQFRTKSKLYNTAQVTAKPVDGMRMRVRRR